MSMQTERVYRVHVAAPPEKAWAALTQPDRTSAWYFGSAVRSSWRVGETIDYVGGDGDLQITGELLTYDPPRSFSHRFLAAWSGEIDDQGTLTWIVEPDGDGCVITLVHAGGHGQETADGSQHIIESLRSHLEVE